MTFHKEKKGGGDDDTLFSYFCPPPPNYGSPILYNHGHSERFVHKDPDHNPENMGQLVQD